MSPSQRATKEIGTYHSVIERAKAVKAENATSTTASASDKHATIAHAIEDAQRDALSEDLKQKALDAYVRAEGKKILDEQIGLLRKKAWKHLKKELRPHAFAQLLQDSDLRLDAVEELKNDHGLDGYAKSQYKHELEQKISDKIYEQEESDALNRAHIAVGKLLRDEDELAAMVAGEKTLMDAYPDIDRDVLAQIIKDEQEAEREESADEDNGVPAGDGSGGYEMPEHEDSEGLDDDDEDDDDDDGADAPIAEDEEEEEYEEDEDEEEEDEDAEAESDEEDDASLGATRQKRSFDEAEATVGGSIKASHESNKKRMVLASPTPKSGGAEEAIEQKSNSKQSDVIDLLSDDD